MKIERLTIKNYRNYFSADVRPCAGVNLFIGDNAQGKTNLLESIYFASVGRSARTPRWQELVKWEEKECAVRVVVKKDAGVDEVSIRLDGEKRIALNGLPITRIGELMGLLKTVLFSPDELKIVKDGPAERRRFMDISLCQLSKAYFYTLTRYNKILAQRNKLLKSSPTDEAIEVWDMQLAREGSKIIKSRRGFVRRLQLLAEEIHRSITSTERLVLEYEGQAGETREEIEGALLAALAKDRPRDKRFMLTHSGPHRDDISIAANDIDLRSYGSQGQQRTAALSLKLAEMELLKAESGEYPILLLDDVLSELDESRQAQLLKRIKPYQTIITCTSLTDEVRTQLGGGIMEFRVTSGSVKELDCNKE